MNTSEIVTRSESDIQTIANDANINELHKALLTLGVNRVSRKYGYKRMYALSPKDTPEDMKGKVNLLVEFSTRPDKSGNFYAIDRVGGHTEPELIHATDKRFATAEIVPSITWYAYVDAKIENERKTVQGIERVTIPKSYVTHVSEDSITLSQYVNTEKSPDTWRLLELPSTTQKAGISVAMLESVLVKLYTRFVNDWNKPIEDQPAYEDLRTIIKNDGSPLNPIAFKGLPDATQARLQKAWDEKHGITRIEPATPIVNADGTLKTESPQ